MRKPRVLRRAGSLGAIALIALMASSASAHVLPMSSSYPGHGYAWMARYTDGGTYIYMNSEDCNGWEVSATDTIRATTQGSQPQFRGAWPSGISIQRASCSGSVTNDTT